MTQSTQTALTHEALLSNLRVLGFQEFLNSNLKKEGTDSILLNSDIFKKHNPKAFQFVSYFLFKQLNYADSGLRMKPLFPCLDKKQEADFRNLVLAYLTAIAKEEPRFPKPVMKLLQCPGGEQFCHLYLAFSNFVLKKLICKTSKRTTLLSDKTLDPETLKTGIRKHLDSYEAKKVLMQVKTKELKAKAELLTRRHSRLSSKLGEKDTVWSSLCQQVGGRALGLEYNEDNFKVVQEMLAEKIEITRNLMASTRSTSEAISKQRPHIDRALESFDVQKNVLEVSSLADDRDLKLATDFVELMASYSKFVGPYGDTLSPAFDHRMEELLGLYAGKSLQAETLRADAGEMKDTLYESLTSVAAEVKDLREKLLKTDYVKERRSRIAKMFPTRLPVIKFEFKQFEDLDKLRSNPEKPLIIKKHPVEILTKKDSLSSPTVGEYSFNFADVSCLHYVAPNTADDSLLLSPVVFASAAAKRKSSTREDSIIEELKQEPEPPSWTDSNISST